MALRVGLLLGRAVAADFPGKGRSSEGRCSPSERRFWLGPEAKKIQANRYTSKERRAASQAAMNQNMPILRPLVERSPSESFPMRHEV